MSRKGKILCILASVLLAVFLLGAFLQERDRQRAQAEAVAAVIAEAAVYEAELAEIEDALAEMAAAIPYTLETTQILIAFELSDPADLTYFQSQAEKYGFSPILVLDCTETLPTLLSCLDAAGETGWEIMLFADSFSETVNENVLSVREALTSRGMADTGVFLLRMDSASEQNIQTLIDDGFLGYTIYSENPTAGYTGEGIFYFDYSYMRTPNETINSRLSLAYANKCPMLVLFEMESVGNGALPESYVVSVLELAATFAGYADAEFSTVAQVLSSLETMRQIEAQRQSAYDAYAALQQSRIDALTARIAEIQSKLAE